MPSKSIKTRKFENQKKLVIGTFQLNDWNIHTIDFALK